MTFELTPECLDEWLTEYDAFFRALMTFSQPVTKCCGYSFEYDSAALHAIHDAWKSECEVWQRTILMPDSNGLSHIKMLAILMYLLAKVPWLTKLDEFDFEASRDAERYEFNGSAGERENARKDINAGHGAYLGYQFAMAVINWFEVGRIDKRQPYVFRMTHDMEHDILVYLLSERRDPMAIFLVLKALFLRDEK